MQQTTLKSLWDEYWQWLITCLFALGWWLWHVFRIEKLVRIRTSQLSSTNKQLQQEIEERELAEEQLSRQQEELAHVARIGTAGELAKGIAHELNQPLSAITSYVQGCEWRLNAGKLSNDEMIDITRRVHQQANRAAGIVERLRNFLRKGEIKLTPMQVNPVVRDALALYSFEAKKHQVSFSVSYTENLPPVNVEVIQLQQVIINLLRNAIDAMSLDKETHRRVDVTTRRGNKGTVVIDIRDYGPGIKPDDLPKLFNQFYTTKSDGMGIGLSLSQSIIESFNGHIRVHAETTPGARFTIELPKADITDEN